MSARIRTHIRSNVIGYVALFVALGGTAVALPGTNTVNSGDIIDNQVYSADVRNDTLSGGGLAAADLKPSSVGASEVANGSLTGADVNESSLSTVPNALIARHGGFGRQSPGPEKGEACNPETTSFVVCAVVNVTTTAPGRALVIGRIQALSETTQGFGDCRLGSIAVNPIPGTTVSFVLDGDTSPREWVTVVGITPPLDPGAHAFGIDCNETVSAPGNGIAYNNARVTAVMLSPD